LPGCAARERNSSGEHFWARGYAVSTVGFELEQAREYIRAQDAAGKRLMVGAPHRNLHELRRSGWQANHGIFLTAA
jgi:hypothetical protein